MAKFASKEWFDLFMKEVNTSETFFSAGRMWEDSFIFVVEADDKHPNEVVVFVDLFRGKCREVHFLKYPHDQKAGYIYAMTYGNWKRVFDGLIDPIKGVASGSIRVEGDMAKFVQMRRAAEELLAAARKVPTEFD
jgi:putative sterol carrier protein